jgi:flagellar FliJ protein
MKFKFSLEKVLQHRKILENLAQRDFQEAQAVLTHNEEILNSLKNQMTQSFEESFKTQHGSGQTSEQLKTIHDFMLGQKVRIQRQEAKIQEIRKLVEEKREILREKATDYKIIERLREKKKAEWLEEMKKKEQKELDDISVLRKVYRDKQQ